MSEQDIKRSQEAFWLNESNGTGLGLVDEIWVERQHQIMVGYTHEHDDRYGVGHAIKHARERLGDESSRAHLIEAIALLVAAVETMDRAEP